MMRPEFAAAGAPLPENLAVSCSWPSGNPRTVIGECWVAEASSRGYVEVFISPVLDQIAGIQGVLVTLRHPGEDPGSKAPASLVRPRRTGSSVSAKPLTRPAG